MRNLILSLLFLVFLITVSGCQTVKSTAIGVGVIGKGLADDAYDTWQAIERADQWIKENYW
ncbi:MAG: hypothetical protein HQ570_02735 [Candidatus Omnitrophica bacterium]|nr:hypothetical protein [Candidatus Omnitrophota bacterium]